MPRAEAANDETRGEPVARRATAAVLAAAVLFGTTGTAQALGPDASDPLTLGAARLVAGGALLALYAAALGRRAALGEMLRSRRGVVCGAAVALYNACFFFGVDRAGVAVGTLVALGSAPFVTGVLAWCLEGARPTGRWLLATAVSVTGLVLLVLSGGEDTGPSVVTGAGFALLAATGYATYTVAGKDPIAGYGPDAYIGAAFGLGALLLSPVLVAGMASGRLAWVASGAGAATVAWLAVVPTAVAYVLFGRGLRHLTAPTVSTLTLAEPLVATALGVVVLRETLSAVGAVGVVLVLAGLLLLASPVAGHGGRRAVPERRPPGDAR